MELDRQIETAVQEPCDSLPKDLYEANPLEVSYIPLLYQNYCMPGSFVGECPIAERCLHYSKSQETGSEGHL